MGRRIVGYNERNTLLARRLHTQEEFYHIILLFCAQWRNKLASYYEVSVVRVVIIAEIVAQIVVGEYLANNLNLFDRTSC